MNKNFLLAAVCCLMVSDLFAGSPKKTETVATNNPIAYVTNLEKQKMLKSLKDLDGTQRFLEMNYTADYKLEEALSAQMTTIPEIMEFMSKNLFDKPKTEPQEMGYSAGCSAFAATDPETGNYLMGRNYDEYHINPVTKKDEPITAILVRTAPKEGKKSIGMTDTNWIGLKKGFYTDGKTDLSILMISPYCIVDGINEDGLAVGALYLDGNACVQDDPGKRPIGPTIAMRLILDKCSDVQSAIDTLKNYNMHMEVLGGKCNFHFFLADAKGHYCILEYSYKKNANVYTSNPKYMKPLMDKDEFRCVTNYYCDPDLRNNDYLGGMSMHGKLRCDILRDKLDLTEYKLTEDEAMQLLGTVSQRPSPGDDTSHTQWSALYNLSRKTLDIAILKDYKNVFHFEVK